MDIPHFAIPFRFSESAPRSAVENEQDSIDDIADCVHVIIITEPGERMLLPDFGTADQAFLQGGADPDLIENDVLKWEPRVRMAIEEGWDFEAYIQRLRMTVSPTEGGSQ